MLTYYYHRKTAASVSSSLQAPLALVNASCSSGLAVGLSLLRKMVYNNPSPCILYGNNKHTTKYIKAYLRQPSACEIARVVRWLQGGSSVSHGCFTAVNLKFVKQGLGGGVFRKFSDEHTLLMSAILSLYSCIAPSLISSRRQHGSQSCISFRIKLFVWGLLSQFNFQFNSLFTQNTRSLVHEVQYNYIQIAMVYR